MSCHMAEFRVFGFGGVRFPPGTCSRNDLDKISELGTAQYTLMCDDDGGIIDDLIVYHTGDLEYLDHRERREPRDGLGLDAGACAGRT